MPLNIPNALTVVRILLVPVLVVVLLRTMPEGSWIAAGVFVGAALTDGLDGWMARKNEDVTTFGRIMDPIADKLLIAAALVVLVDADRVEAWIAAVIIAREFAVTALRVFAGQQGTTIGSSWLGKAKTTVQIGAITALIAVADAGATWVRVLVFAMVAITVISGLDYFIGVRRQIAQGRERRAHERAVAPGPAKSASAD